MKMDVKIEGVAEIREALMKLPPDIAKAVQANALRKGAMVVRGEVRSAAQQFNNPRPPSRYGRLVRNIRITRIKRTVRGMKAIEPGQTVIAISIGNAFWGRFLEFGTPRMSRRPWMAPAGERALPIALRVITEALRNDIDLVVAKSVRTKTRAAARLARKVIGG